MSINYKNTKIYKIWSPQGDKIYIGSTTKELLCQRMTAHRKEYRKWKKTNIQCVTSYLLFEEYGIENCFIELLEARECSSKDELRQLEGKYIRELTCVNRRIEGRTRKEYREDHKDEIKCLKYKSFNCACGSTYTNCHQTRHERTKKHQTFISNLSYQQ
jgi:hypothetical protein